MFSYLRRHWRGELPLAITWWVNVVAITAASLALDLYGGALGLAPVIDTRASFTVMVTVSIVLLLIVPAWQLVGVFRAADRHAERHGRVFAARATQSLATVLAFLLAMRFLVLAAESASAARVAYGIGSNYTVTVSHEGRMLELNGGLVFGVADAVAAALAANPDVRRVRLNSGGGSLSEARRLRALIELQELDTDSTSNCSSACISAYMAGRHRLLHRSARLGFHLPRNPGFGVRGTVTPEYSAELAWFGRRGVPLWFRERWIATGRTFWYPTPEQLVQAGFVQSFFGRPRLGEEVYFR